MTILVIDESPIARSALVRLLEEAGHTVTAVAGTRQARKLPDQAFALVLLDYATLGATPLHELLQAFPGSRCVLLAADIDVQGAVLIMKDGATDVLPHPCDPEVLLNAVGAVLPPPDQSDAGARQDAFAGMIGSSAAMQSVYRYIQRAAPTDATMLITGETGSGKELAARAAHALSKRRNAAFVAVNCAAIPETLVEAELFGNEKGAFTGAVATRKGLVEAADHGTLFLDEVGELPMEAQARLLRVLQEGEVRRVGATRTRSVDVRVLAATHRDLAERVRAGRFREDLYYRLHVLSVRMPPLRERTEDIPALAQNILQRIAKPMNLRVTGIRTVALERLGQHAWPGNIRELDNVLHRACILSDEPMIGPHHLQFDDISCTTPADPVRPAVQSRPRLTLEQYVEHFLLTNQHCMTETEIARNLGISRKCLWEKRQRLGIPRLQRSGVTPESD